MKALSSCIDYPFSTVTIGGTEYYTFKFRRNEEVYTASGSSWGTVASGMEVACRTDAMGDSHPDWKLINYVKRSSDGQWVAVTVLLISASMWVLLPVRFLCTAPGNALFCNFKEMPEIN